MLEFYIQNRKRWKDRSLNKRRRVLLNGISSEGEPLWAGPYIAAIRSDEWYRRDKLSHFNRYLSRQVGKYAPDVYSDLSHRPIYRQNRYLLKEAFMREMQRESEYHRDWNEFIEAVPPLNTYVQRPLTIAIEVTVLYKGDTKLKQSFNDGGVMTITQSSTDRYSVEARVSIVNGDDDIHVTSIKLPIVNGKASPTPLVEYLKTNHFGKVSKALGKLGERLCEE